MAAKQQIPGCKTDMPCGHEILYMCHCGKRHHERVCGDCHSDCEHPNEGIWCNWECDGCGALWLCKDDCENCDHSYGGASAF